MLANVRKWGNSQGLRAPRALLDEAGLGLGDEVAITVRRGTLVIEPVRKVRGGYDLKKLVAAIPKDYRPGEHDWGGALGKEAW